MNLLIVDNNISYANNLKKLLVKKMGLKGIRVMRNIKTITSENLRANKVVLFEPNKENLTELKKYFSNNKRAQTIFVALAKESESQQLVNAVLAGVSSIIYKTGKIEFIVEELKLVLRGKVVLPQKIVSSMKETITTKEIEKPNSQIKKILAKYIIN